MKKPQSEITHIVSAVELNEKSKQKIEKVFAAKHDGRAVEFVYEIDRNLIGGILVIDGDEYYDGTLKGQLNNIERALN